jgi:hypothetical protein
VRNASIRLDDDQLEQLADLVAARLSRTPSARSPLVDARELARLLGVSRSVIYQHARALGAVRIGAGETGRLRFDPSDAMRAAASMAVPDLAAPVRPGSDRPRALKKRNARTRRPFLEPTAVWDSDIGLWRDPTGCPTKDQCWRSDGRGTQALAAEGPNNESGATHPEWEAARREWRKEHRQGVKPSARAQPSV